MPFKVLCPLRLFENRHYKRLFVAKNTFHSVLRRSDVALVLFYFPWDGSAVTIADAMARLTVPVPNLRAAIMAKYLRSLRNKEKNTHISFGSFNYQVFCFC